VIQCRRRTIEDLRRISRLVGCWEDDSANRQKEEEGEEKAMIGKNGDAGRPKI